MFTDTYGKRRPEVGLRTHTTLFDGRFGYSGIVDL